MTRNEKIFFGVVLSMMVIGSYFIFGHTVSLVRQQSTANPDVLSFCQQQAEQSGWRAPSTKFVVVVEDCLVLRDPVYASARLNEMCNQVKASGAKFDAFPEDFRKKCQAVKPQ